MYYTTLRNVLLMTVFGIYGWFGWDDGVLVRYDRAPDFGIKRSKMRKLIEFSNMQVVF